MSVVHVGLLLMLAVALAGVAIESLKAESRRKAMHAKRHSRRAIVSTVAEAVKLVTIPDHQSKELK